MVETRVIRSSDAPERDSGMWFDAPKYQAHKQLPAYIDTNINANQSRYANYVRYAALYGNWESTQQAGAFLRQGGTPWRKFRRLSFNVCQSMVDTVVNQRAAEAPALMAVSQDGDYRTFVRGRMLTQALKCEFLESNHDMKFPRVANNALAFGNGYCGVERNKNGTRLARIFSPEIVVNPFDTICDEWPNVVSHVRFVNKYTLKADYKKFSAEIDAAASDPSNYSRMRGDDNIRVDESWLLSVNGKMGRHVCCIANATFVDEDYEFETPPFVTLPWGMPFQGFYSQGLIDQLVGLQLEINDILDIVHQATALFANPFMLIENGSNVNPAHIQDIPGKLIKYTNTPPTIVAPQLLSPEVYAHLERCYSKAYEIAGINPYAAQAKTLPRYESSKAMRMANEQGEVRHFSFAKACERYHTDLGALICRENAIAAEEFNYKTRMPHSIYWKDIDWKEIAYDVKNFKIQIDTVNKQADSVSGNVQDLQDLAQLQLLSVPELRRYLLNPDMKRVLSTITASDEFIDWTIYKLAYEEEKEMRVNPFMDLNAAFAACVAEYLNGIRLGMSPQAQANLLNYILEIQEVQKAREQEAMQMQAEAQMAAQSKMMQAPVQPQQPLTQPGSQV